MVTAFAQQPRHWYRDRTTRSFIVLGYLPWLGVMNLVWEIAQLPLYTVWAEDSLPFIAFVVAHCTLGDLVIGTSSLAFALVATRAGAVDGWKFPKVGLITVITGVGYTVLSEWVNSVVRESWKYSALMPVMNFGGFEIGLAPLLQWLVIPPVALWLAGFRSVNRMEKRWSSIDDIR